MASCTAPLTAANSRDTTHMSWAVSSACSLTVSAVMRHKPPPKNRSKSACHFVTRLAGTTTSCLAEDRSAQTCRSLGVLGGEFCLVCELLNGGIECGVGRAQGWRCLGIDPQVQCL